MSVITRSAAGDVFIPNFPIETLSSGEYVMPALSDTSDCDGFALTVGDVVVQAVMTQSGPVCPKMSASPEMFEVYMLLPEMADLPASSGVSGPSWMPGLADLIGLSEMYGKSGYVLIKSVSTGKAVMVHSSEIAWVGHDETIEADFA